MHIENRNETLLQGPTELYEDPFFKNLSEYKPDRVWSSLSYPSSPLSPPPSSYSIRFLWTRVSLAEVIVVLMFCRVGNKAQSM